MIVKYEYDQDPRYGWASVDVSEDSNPLIVVHTSSGSKGYTLNSDDQLVPTCICHAYSASECACPDVTWECWDDD